MLTLVRGKSCHIKFTVCLRKSAWIIRSNHHQLDPLVDSSVFNGMGRYHAYRYFHIAAFICRATVHQCGLTCIIWHQQMHPLSMLDFPMFSLLENLIPLNVYTSTSFTVIVNFTLLYDFAFLNSYNAMNACVQYERGGGAQRKIYFSQNSCSTRLFTKSPLWLCII